jgi:DNA-binding MarR family transcriptional regulator
MRNLKVRKLLTASSVDEGKVTAMASAVSPVDAGQAYMELHHQAHRLMDRAMGAAGLSLGRAKVLMRLGQHGPMNQARLAGLLGFAPRSVTETIDALERDGLVTRTEDPNDRRARIVQLTDAGRDALDVATTVRSKTMGEIFGVLAPAQRAQLVSLLDTIRTNLVQGEIDCGN